MKITKTSTYQRKLIACIAQDEKGNQCLFLEMNSVRSFMIRNAVVTEYPETIGQLSARQGTINIYEGDEITIKF